MRKAFFALLGLASLLQVGIISSFAHGSQALETTDFLSRARRLEDLRSETTAAFELRAHIDAKVGKNLIPGEYSLIWAGPDRWREQLVISDFQRLRFGTAGGYRQVRSLDYQPQIAFDFDKAVDVASILRLGPGQTAESPKERKVEGLRLSCIGVRSQKSVYEQLCFDPSDGILAHAEIGVDLRSTEEVVDWSSPISFGDQRFPSKITIRRSGRFSADITLSLQRSLTVNPDLFSGPAGAEFWADCRDSIPAQVLEIKPSGTGPGPGFAAVYVRVEPDGTASHVKTLMSSSASIGNAIQKAAENAKFKPRMCGTTAVRDETVLDLVTMAQ
jgi:hypothetical protein